MSVDHVEGAADPQRLVGFAVPGARGRVEAYENTLLQDAVHAPRRPEAHGIWAFLAPQRGMGLTLAELFEALGCPLSDGPLLGSFAARWRRPLRCDAEFTVSGSVTPVRRGHGRVLGVYEEVRLVLELTDPGRGGGHDLELRVPAAPARRARAALIGSARVVTAPPARPRSTGGRRRRPRRGPSGRHGRARAAAAGPEPHPLRPRRRRGARLRPGVRQPGPGQPRIPAHRARPRDGATHPGPVVAGDVVRPVVTADGPDRWSLVLRRADGAAVVTAQAGT